MTNHLNEPKSYARLPTFVEVIDILVAGFGIDANKENSLRNLGVFEYRVRVYNGSDVGGLRDFSKDARNKSDTVLAFEKCDSGEQEGLSGSENKGSPGLRDELLSLLAGSDKKLNEFLLECLDRVESEISEGRSYPLVTMCSMEDGYYFFIKEWAIPWIVSIIYDSDEYPDSVLHLVKKIFMQENCNGLNYLRIWKNFIKSLIPEGARVPEFRGAVDKIEKNSLRKLKLIESDVESLTWEIRGSDVDESEANFAIKKIHAAYIAGMAVLRFQSMALKACPGMDLIDQLVYFFRHYEEAHRRIKFNYGTRQLPHPSVDERDLSEHRFERIFINIGNRVIPDDICFLENPERHRWRRKAFRKVFVRVFLNESYEIFRPYVKYAQGLWHLGHAELHLAEKYLTEFISVAGGRQLGETAKNAASILIALRLLKLPEPKFQELNPLIGIIIESMRQQETWDLPYWATPFSGSARLPEILINDSYVLQSVFYFNSLPSAAGCKLLCNPMSDLCVKIDKYILASKKEGAKLLIREKNTVAILGTSIKPYDAICYIYFYVSKLFGEGHPDLDLLDDYCRLPDVEKRRVLRYIDEERYLKDCAKYKISD